MTTEEKTDLLLELACFTTHQDMGYESAPQAKRFLELREKLQGCFAPDALCRSGHDREQYNRVAGKTIEMAPEQAAAISDTQIVTPPTHDIWEKFKGFALELQRTQDDVHFISLVRGLQLSDPWLIGMVAWHEIVAQETRLRNLSIQSHAEAAAAEGRNARFGAGRRMP